MREMLVPVTVAAALLGGCLEREERIVVRDDGSVSVELSFRADSDEELYLGDAVPSEDRGWMVSAWTEHDEQGREIFRLTAEQSFEPGVALPESLGDLRDPYRDVTLRFPSSVMLEPRADGTYYHFRRVYRARPWAQLEVMRQKVLEQAGPLDRDRLEQLGPAEAAAVVDALAGAEVTRLVHFARLAFADVTPEAPQDAWLAVRAAAADALADLDSPALAQLLLEAEEDPAAAAALERSRAELEHRTLAAMQAALRDTGRYPPSQINRFLHRFDQHRMAHRVTEDLGDERFTVRVRMPGTVVGHNGSAEQDGVVTWTFDGSMLRDREVELMATSRR
jgi:hypothetical protein